MSRYLDMVMFKNDNDYRIEIDNDDSRDDNENGNNDNIQGGPLHVVTKIYLTTPLNGLIHG